MLALLLALTAFAAPGYIPLQGSLADASGAAIDGAVDVTFTLYADGSGATSLWQDTLTLDVVGGAFAAELGSSVPLELDLFRTYGQVHLGVQVGGDSEMPLVPLDHVPYAAWAERTGEADTLGGVSLAALRSEIPLPTDLEQAARDAAYDTEAELTAALDDNYMRAAYTPAWSALTGVPAGFADGTDDGYTTEAQLTAALDDNYLSAAYTPAWSALTGVPAGFADGVDDDTQLSQAAVEAYAQGVCYDSTSELTSALAGEYVAATLGTATNLTANGTLGVGNKVWVSNSNDTVGSGSIDGSVFIGASGSANIGIDSDEIMARSVGTPTTLHLQRDGGTVHIGGELDVDGDIRCPPGTGRAGRWCIGAKKAAGSWSLAHGTCMGEGLELCPLRALLTCDQLNTPTQCAEATDSPFAQDWLWAAETDVDDGNVLSQGLGRVYANNGDNDANEADWHAKSLSHSYFCCTSR